MSEDVDVRACRLACSQDHPPNTSYGPHTDASLLPTRLPHSLAATFREDMGSRMSELTLDLKTGAASLRQVGPWLGLERTCSAILARRLQGPLATHLRPSNPYSNPHPADGKASCLRSLLEPMNCSNVPPNHRSPHMPHNPDTVLACAHAVHTSRCPPWWETSLWPTPTSPAARPSTPGTCA